MKRKRIALLVACAALVLCVVVVQQNWKWIAYVRHDVPPVREPSLFMPQRPIAEYRKRYEWLPGRKYWIPDQVCAACLPDERESMRHKHEVAIGEVIAPPDLVERYSFERFRCICQECFAGRTAR